MSMSSWLRLRGRSRTGRADRAQTTGRRASQLVAEADRLRSAGEWARAAALYGEAAEVMNERWDLRVQQANMLKDCGRLAEAQAIYRRCIVARPRDADVRLQMGHALKLAGDRQGAIDSYDAALMLDPLCDDARRELVEIGRAHRHTERIEAARRGDFGEPLVETLARIAELEKALADLRARLPEITRLGVFPLSCYDVFRDMWPRLPEPPAHAPVRALFVLVPHADRLGDAHAGFAGVRSQDSGEWRLLGIGSVAREALAPSALAEPRIGFAEEATEAAIAEAFGEWRPDWVVPLLDGAVPDPLLLGWVGAAASLRAADGFVTDEEVRARDTLGRWRCSEPRLHRHPDLDGVLSGELIGATPVLRAAAWYQHSESGADNAAAAAILDLAWEDRLAHIPLPLVHRREVIEPEPLGRYRERVQALLKRQGATAMHVGPSPVHPGVLRCDWPDDETMRISVIIPTRDNPVELGIMIDSLLNLAARPERVEIVVVDNGETPVALAARSAVRRLAMPGAFNWSHFNNLAADAATGDILVFANDDMRMLTPDWDRRLSSLLARSSIGVVGARLLYPSGSIQHAGILTGWRGSLVHDGLGADAEDPGPELRWFRPRQVTAVTGAFLATRRKTFETASGFDAAALPVAYSDADFCRRVQRLGFALLWDAEMQLLHRESTTRGMEHCRPEDAARAAAERTAFIERWPETVNPDPWLNPAFADFGQPCQHIRAVSTDIVINYFGQNT